MNLNGIKFTYGELLDYDRQIMNQQKNHAICELANRSFYQEFYNKFRMRIETAKRELGDLDAKFIVKGEDGKYEIIETEGKKSHKIKDGLEFKDYQEEINKILSREILM